MIANKQHRIATDKRSSIRKIFHINNIKELEEYLFSRDAEFNSFRPFAREAIALLEFSNYCESDCFYCSYRKNNILSERFRLEPNEVLNYAKRISNLGYRSLILQSGIDFYYDSDIIAYLIYRVKASTNLKIILSLGERSFDDYKNWKIAGADGYFLKFETTNRKIFAEANCGRYTRNRLNHIGYLKSLGYEIGTGAIIGLPGLSVEDTINDIEQILKLTPEYILLDAFQAKKNTPFQNKKSAGREIFLKSIAAIRMLSPESKITIGQFSPLHFSEINSILNFNIRIEPIKVTV